MDDFSRELGICFLHLLWQISGCPDSEDDSESARHLLISEVVDRIRGESFAHDSDLRELADGFSDRMSGRAYGHRAKQFADGFVSFVVGDEPIEALLTGVKEARESIPKHNLSTQELAEKQRDYEEAKDRYVTHLKRIGDGLSE